MSISNSENIFGLTVYNHLQESEKASVDYHRAFLHGALRKDPNSKEIKSTKEMAYQKLSSLSHDLINYNSPSKTLNSRARHIGTFLDEMVQNKSSLPARWVVGFFSITKNSIHQEACLFAPLIHSLSFKSEFINSCKSSIEINPRLDGIIELVPDIFENLKMSTSGGNSFTLNLSHFISKFINKDINMLSVEFHSYVLTFLSDFPIENDEIKFPIEKIPSLLLIHQLVFSDVPELNLLGKIFYVMYLVRQNTEPAINAIFILRKILSIVSAQAFLDKNEPTKHLELLSSSVPFMATILKWQNRCLDLGIEFKELFKVSDIFEELNEMQTEDWQSELIAYYDLLLKVENIVSKMIGSNNYSTAVKSQSERYVSFRASNFIQSFIFSNSPVRESPIKEGGFFCETIEDFDRLTNIWNLVYIEKKAPIENMSTNAIDVKQKSSPSKKSKSSKPRKSSHKKAHSEKTTPSLALEEESTENIQAEPSTISDKDYGTTDAISTSSSPEKMLASTVPSIDIFKARRAAESTLLHPRVSSFMSSAQEGLAYRGDEINGFDLDEFILTHRFPKEILYFIFHDQFTKHTISQGCNQYNGIILIDGTKYILEATVDEKNMLYHLFARKITSFSDYWQRQALKMTVDSNAEFPPLAATKSTINHTIAHEPETAHRDLNLQININGDVEFSFEGHHYKMINLQPS